MMQKVNKKHDENCEKKKIICNFAAIYNKVYGSSNKNDHKKCQ